MRDEPCSDKTTRPLEVIFLILFGQIVGLILLSFVLRQGLVLMTEPRFFAQDYYEFYNAFGTWLRGVDPYTDPAMQQRLVSPPFSILAGGLFHWVVFEKARVGFLLLNLLLLGWSVERYGRHIGLCTRNRVLMMMIAATYYPVYFVLERGNLDALMLALLVFAFTAKSRLAGAIALGASIGLKLYSGMYLLMLAYRRRWKLLAAAATTAVVLQLPFAHLLGSFVDATLYRSSHLLFQQDFSPGSLVGLACMIVFKSEQMGRTNAILFVFWIATLVRKLTRSKDETMEDWALYVPWMMAFPAMVYPYTGVLLLAMLAYLVRQNGAARLRSTDLLMLGGFVLTGTQAFGWQNAFAGVLGGFGVVHILNTLGVLALLLGACVWEPPTAETGTMPASPTQEVQHAPWA